MPWTVAIILALLWVFGLVTHHTFNGFVHFLLLAAMVVVAVQTIQSRRAKRLQKPKDRTALNDWESKIPPLGDDWKNRTPPEIIGMAKSQAGNEYEVKYDRNTTIVWVSYCCWTEIGKAQTVSDAMQKAREFLFNK